jgi:hypothetical protein
MDYLPLMDHAAKADEFARNFIEEVAKGEADSAFEKLSTELKGDNAKRFLEATGENIATLRPDEFKIVEQRIEAGTEIKTGQEKQYRLGYEYPFDRGFAVFFVTLRQKAGATEITSFNVDYLPEPLKKITAFNLNDKSPIHYLFLFFGVAVPFFVITTIVAMLRSAMTVKKKILWTLLILLVNMPQFTINWATADIDFSTFSISLLGFGISRPALYVPWIISFNLPLGAAGYWFQAISNDGSMRIEKAKKRMASNSK